MRPRAFVVGRAEAGRPVSDYLRTRLALGREAVARLVRQRQVRVNGTSCLDPARRLRAGQRVEILPAPAQKRPSRSEPGRPDAPRARREQARPAPEPQASPGTPTAVIRYVDEHVVVVEKPAGLTTMRHAEEAAEFGSRGRRFLPTTLADLLPAQLPPASRRGGPGKVRAVHRLDKETSGLIVFARTPAAESHLGKQFRARSTERHYLALVRGKARSGRIESWLVRDRGDGRRGSGPQSEGAQKAVTHVRVVEDLGDFTLVECRLETGRTHQVRIHLGEAGNPLCGEKVYDRPVNGRPYPDDSGATRITLHAASLGFDHPATGERMRWEADLPKDMARLLTRLRKRKAEREADAP